ncbi:hypothetical protein TNCV_3851551 [Trichonephila clavipes]|nr:hypothetical protein TNCV_3851551 [Trichonephila clavipes]
MHQPHLEGYYLDAYLIYRGSSSLWGRVGIRKGGPVQMSFSSSGHGSKLRGKAQMPVFPMESRCERFFFPRPVTYRRKQVVTHTQSLLSRTNGQLPTIYPMGMRF